MMPADKLTKLTSAKTGRRRIGFHLCRETGRLYTKKSNKIIFYLCFCQHDALSVDIDILCPSLGSVFLESALFSHPEIYWQSWPQQKLEDVDLDSTFAGKPGNFFLKIINKYFRFKFLPTWCPFLWILISFLHHWVHKDLLFLEAVFFSHPEICKRLKSADYIRWVKMSRRGTRRLKPSVGGRPVMSTVQKILCSSILIQTLCVKGRQVWGCLQIVGGLIAKLHHSDRVFAIRILHLHFALSLNKIL